MLKISIVTISYNQGKYLEETIRSVLDQNYPQLEYILVDSGSTDGSREIIERYADRIHRIIFEPDKGPADGLNKGFALATGKVYGYINSDDILLPGALAKVAAYFEAHRDVDVLIGNGLQLDSNGVVIRKLRSSKWRLNRYAYDACAIVQQGNFFKQSVFERVGGFNVSNRTCWDAELLVDISIAGAKFFKVQDLFGGFRMYPESISGSGRLNAQIKIDHRRIFKKITGKDLHWFNYVLGFYYRAMRKLSLILKLIIEKDADWFNEIMSLWYKMK